MSKILTSLAIAACVALASSSQASEPQSHAAVKRSDPVRTGELAPDFMLNDQNGRSHTLSAERGKRAVVLVFYRGYW